MVAQRKTQPDQPSEQEGLPNTVSSDIHALRLEVLREMLNQSRHLHRMHLLSIVFSFVVVAAGIVLLTQQKNVEGAVTSSVGSTATALCSRFSQFSKRDADRKLDKLLKALSDQK
jgi:hypothetical protein